MKNTGTGIICTSRREFRDHAKREFKNIINNAVFTEWLSDSICIFTCDNDFHTISEQLRNQQPIFIRHISPIQKIINIETTGDLIKSLKQSVMDIIKEYGISKGLTASVQTRLTDSADKSIKRFDVNNALAEIITGTGTIIDVKNPEQILSVLISNDRAFLGLSDTADNLSDWAGGERRFAKSKNQISRAEFKIMEAIEVFELNNIKVKNALDMGSAPGGWARVLREKFDCRVTAVDPADIDITLVRDKKVSHVKKTIQQFIKQHQKRPFDMIVNDMKMETKQSALIMCEASDNLIKGSISVMTLKLPKSHIETAIKSAISILERKYNVLGVKNLFHNRHEVTAVLKKH